MYENAPESHTSSSFLQKVAIEVGRIAIPGSAAGAVLTFGADAAPEQAFPAMIGLAAGTEAIRKYVLEPLRYN